MHVTVECNYVYRINNNTYEDEILIENTNPLTQLIRVI